MVIVSHHRVGRHACFLRFHGNVLNSDNKHPPRLIMLLTLLFIRPRSYTSVPYGNISHTFPITPIFARRYYVQQPSADDKLPFTLSTHCRRQKGEICIKKKYLLRICMQMLLIFKNPCLSQIKYSINSSEMNHAFPPSTGETSK